MALVVVHSSRSVNLLGALFGELPDETERRSEVILTALFLLALFLLVPFLSVFFIVPLSFEGVSDPAEPSVPLQNITASSYPPG